MQRSVEEYDSGLHDRYQALTIPQPFADRYAQAAYKDNEGNTYGDLYISTQDFETDYRGKILLCSSIKPYFPNRRCGDALAMAELYEIKPIGELNESERAFIPNKGNNATGRSFAWFLRNPKRLIEIPVFSKTGFEELVFDKDEIIVMPEKIVLDGKAWGKIKRSVNK